VFFFFFGDKTKSNVTDWSHKGIFLWKQMRQNLRILKFPYNMVAYQCFFFSFFLFFFGDNNKKIQCDSSYKGIFCGNKCGKIWQLWNYLYLDNRFLAGHQNIAGFLNLFIYLFIYLLFSLTCSQIWLIPLVDDP
jgi:hypothetical protein